MITYESGTYTFFEMTDNAKSVKSNFTDIPGVKRRQEIFGDKLGMAL